VTLSPRAALLIAPALIVTAGAVLLGRDADQAPLFTGWANNSGPDNMLDPSVADQDSARMICQKQAVALDLLCGRCRLEDAADRIVEISESFPQGLDRLRVAWPGRTDRERAIVQAVSFARSLTRREPDRFSEALGRIEKEARVLLGNDI
jgi:hypothetical protein